MHPRAEGAFEIVEIDDHDLGRLGAARRTARDVDFAHDVGERIFVQVELSHAQHGGAVLGKQELVIF